MEADSVVCCVSENGDKNVRVNVMRACSKLNIVYTYYNDAFKYIDFSSAKLDPTFMAGCDEEMKERAFKCLTCEKKENKFDNNKEDEDGIIVCKSCRIRCHSGHNVMVVNAKFSLDGNFLMCECKTN